LKIKADYFDGKSSKETPVEIEFFENGLVKVKGEGVEFERLFEEVTFSSRIGNTPRVIHFNDSSKAYSDENDKIDELLKKKRGKKNLIHTLESRSTYALFALICLIAVTIYFLTFGSDKIARFLAYKTPTSIEKSLSDQTLKILDSYILKKSTSSDVTKERVRKIFKRVTKDDKDLHIHFRRGIGENAFALPSGDIVIMDELIEFSKGDDDMIFGILAHETGHVEHKHSMQLVIKASIVTAVVSYFTADISALVASLTTSLINAKYSREFEREADIFAKKRMQEEGISPKHLADFFIKMDKKIKGRDEGFLASHPSNRERIEFLLK
jgi:Zn-dependent protease with chaperone function